MCWKSMEIELWRFFLTKKFLKGNIEGDDIVPKPLTVNEAAAQMGVTGDLLREGLKQNKFPFGVAVKMKKRFAYYINERQFKEYLRGN